MGASSYAVVCNPRAPTRWTEDDFTPFSRCSWPWLSWGPLVSGWCFRCKSYLPLYCFCRGLVTATYVSNAATPAHGALRDGLSFSPLPCPVLHPPLHFPSLRRSSLARSAACCPSSSPPPFARSPRRLSLLVPAGCCVAMEIVLACPCG